MTTVNYLLPPSLLSHSWLNRSVHGRKASANRLLGYTGRWEVISQTLDDKQLTAYSWQQSANLLDEWVSAILPKHRWYFYVFSAPWCTLVQQPVCLLCPAASVLDNQMLQEAACFFPSCFSGTTALCCMCSILSSSSQGVIKLMRSLPDSNAACPAVSIRTPHPPVSPSQPYTWLPQ